MQKLEKAKAAFLEQEKEDRREIIKRIGLPTVKLWYVSTGGFTEEALEYLKKKDEVYYLIMKG